MWNPKWVIWNCKSCYTSKSNYNNKYWTYNICRNCSISQNKGSERYLLLDRSGAGTLTPDSLINSKEISIISISKITGNGTLLLDATIANKSSVGTNSWWNVVTATYRPGRSKVMKSARNLIALSKFASWNFIFLS